MPPPAVLHYTGYRDDRGGIVAVIRALAAANRFPVVHGVSADYAETSSNGRVLWRGPAIDGERINLATIWRARAVAQAARGWLAAEPGRIFHGHSRAGLLVALWLHAWGERLVVASVHCYGRQRWFYRWAARRLGRRLFWLTPAMREYYGVAGDGWEQCLPGGVTEDFSALTPATPVPGKLRLGAAGALVRWKHWELIPQALALLPAEISGQISCEHIGAEAADADSRAYAAELRTAGGIAWRGPEVSSHRLLAEVDLVVVASDAEPYSMILQEAWAAGLPVIAPAAGGPGDVVWPGINGWLFRPNDARALAELLEQRVRARDWSVLDRAAIRRSARRAADVAVEWKKIYAQL